MGEDGYGFFCDLESAKTMEYEKVEFYIVTKRTHYEVRRKPLDTKRNRITTTIEVENDPTCCVRVEPSPRKNIDDLIVKEPTPTPKNCFQISLSYLARLPRDVYYSLAVCTITSSCVYLVMTMPN